MWPRRKDKGKGKARAAPVLPFRAPRRRRGNSGSDGDVGWALEGVGGSADGVVLPLQYVSDGPYATSYTLPVIFGDENTQNLSLQVDTGSSDMWVASTSCGSSACGNAPLYSSTSAIPTALDFSIQYLMGNVSGPVYWDTVTVGGYGIESQAFAAADTVDSEPLQSHFSGLLGLALPSNSIIAEEIPPQLGDTPDGATFSSNLLGITPISPSSRFLSLAFERPGSDTVPSILGIGRHPSALVPDPSKIAYDVLYAPGNAGPLFWKASVREITVYTNTSRLSIPLGRGVSGVFPSAVLDSGVPVILTTSSVANAIYGAIGVQPAADNNYYYPCTTPLNMTITLDDRKEISIHPLDLSTPPGSDAPDQNSCIGLIQASQDAALRNPSSGIGDMVLGISFLRNVYTVLAYDVPASNGSFPSVTINSTNATVHPRLGLLGLTDPTVALEEFHRVRVLNQPLSNSDGGNSPASKSRGSHKSNVGIDVLIGLGSFLGLCLLIFGVRWLVKRRAELRRGHGADYNRDAKTRSLALALGGYELAPRRWQNGGGDGGGAEAGADPDGVLPTEDELRKRRYDAYMHSLRTVSTDRTQFDEDPAQLHNKDGSSLNRVTTGEFEQTQRLSSPPPTAMLSPRDDSPFLTDNQEHSPEAALRHSRGALSVDVPLLPAVDTGDANANVRADGGAEADTEDPAQPPSMAGVGAAFARGRSTSRPSRLSSAPSLSPTAV
ncbi:acid protease [Favolaschia claudopus]|uniref:Acid protease n=1 Tax=Favolaschia claudopus TaxID=2862362 RepID=A0AAW0D1G4_9AGAR